MVSVNIQRCVPTTVERQVVVKHWMSTLGSVNLPFCSDRPPNQTRLTNATQGTEIEVDRATKVRPKRCAMSHRVALLHIVFSSDILIEKNLNGFCC